MKSSLVSIIAAAALAASATAAIPVMQITANGTGGGSGSSTPTGTASGTPNQYNYTGIIYASSFRASFSLVAQDTTKVDRAVLGGTFTMINTSAATQTFSIDISASTMAQGLASLTGGSVSGTLTGDSTGGSFTSVAGQPIWAAYIKNGATSTTVSTMLNDPYSRSVGANLVASIPGQSFGTPIPSMPAGAMGDAVGIRLRFTLTAGERVDLSTTFVVQSAIPAPGALALAAIASGSRRRRR
jgi:hypothetical protein